MVCTRNLKSCLVELTAFPWALGLSTMALGCPGIPNYNDARAAYNLSRATSFANITSDKDVEKKLRHVYDDDISKLDALTGALAESNQDAVNLVFGELLTVRGEAERKTGYANADAVDCTLISLLIHFAFVSTKALCLRSTSSFRSLDSCHYIRYLSLSGTPRASTRRGDMRFGNIR